ncbi:MAG: hypothetical protein WAW36_00040 [Methylovulum miyakonense]|uniref:hypothetical protein n=1 Tax=Methylovulum miyakonense TaxID=645578 RepID=UPI003BB54C4F
MIEPVALKDFFITFFVSALIILSGAAYALLFAWSKANPDGRIRLAAYSAYLILAASVAELTYTAHFSGYWLTVSAAMLIGYFFAPIGIWHLCVKTHTDHDLTTTEEDKL